MAADIDIVIGAQDKASAVINSVASGVTSMGGSLAKLGPAAIGIGVAIAGAAASFMALRGAMNATMEAADRIDALTDKAAGLGEAVGDLQAFQFAMSEAGNVDAEKSIQALQKVQKAVGEIATGGGGAGKEVFAKLGLDANALSLQGPIDQFNTVREALGGVENISERAAMAQQLLGKSAADLMPALMAETDAFKESMQAASDLGVVVTEEGAAGIAAMNDALGRVSAGMEGLANQAASAVAPLIESIATSIAEWIPPAMTVAKEIMPTLVEYMARGLGYAIDIGTALYKIATLDFSGAMETFRNMDTGDKLVAKMDEAVKRSAQTAQENAAKNAAIAAVVAKASDDEIKAEEKKKAAADKTTESLERKLAVLQMGEDAVRRQEELATATNDAERARIETLQKQIDLQEESNKLAEEKVNEEKELQKQQEQEAEKAMTEAKDKADKLSSFAGGTQAAESRLLTRGPEAKGIDKIAKESEKSNSLLTQIKNVLEQTGVTSSGPQLEFIN